jgi:alkanesulfonate monooxygenase SsuD/methylene tetrahydromethanopterin reductase-like flavin-dependent oxidoreductase (luciferase family)
VLTGGRLRIGVGLGWNRVEYPALDMPFATRGARIEEQIELLRLLWTAPVEEFGGRFHGIRGAALVPRPTQQPIPTWMGANLGSPALERAGRLADGWIVFRAQPGDQLNRDAERVLAAVIEAGRDPLDFGIQGRPTIDVQDPDTVRAQIESWRSFGATHLAIATARELPRSADEHTRTLSPPARSRWGRVSGAISPDPGLGRGPDRPRRVSAAVAPGLASAPCWRTNVQRLALPLRTASSPLSARPTTIE